MHDKQNAYIAIMQQIAKIFDQHQFDFCMKLLQKMYV